MSHEMRSIDIYVKFSLADSSFKILIEIPRKCVTSPDSLYVTICQGGFCVLIGLLISYE